MLTWLLCATTSNTLHAYKTVILQTFFTFDTERVVPVKFSSSNYTVRENRRSFTGTLETPGYHARAFTVYVVPSDTNATATGEHHAVYSLASSPRTYTSMSHLCKKYKLCCFIVAVNTTFAYIHSQSITLFILALVCTFHLSSGGTDYRSARIPVTFYPGRNERTFTVTIYDDFILEFDEYFFLDLEIPTAASVYGVAKDSPDRAIVHIEDDGETC